MTIDTVDQLEGLKLIGAIVADVLQAMGRAIEPGMTTLELDRFGHKLLEEKGARSAPILTYNFPGATCISINHCVAHGIPDGTKIRAGDMVNIDVSAERNGFFGDTGGTFLVPPHRKNQERVCAATREARDLAIKQVRPGAPLNVIGKSIEFVARKNGMRIIRNLGSHGVGAALHEEPKFIHSYYEKRDKRQLTDGMVLTVEPFLSTKAEKVVTGDDGWSLFTHSDSLTAQYEHTLVVTRSGPVITTIPTKIAN